jgi:hypothetical protein
MPQIIVRADPTNDGDEGAITMQERVVSDNLDSSHFGAQLIERVAWAVRDAHDAERSVLAHARGTRTELQLAS